MKFSVVCGARVEVETSVDPNSLSKLSKNDSSSAEKASWVVEDGSLVVVSCFLVVEGGCRVVVGGCVVFLSVVVVILSVVVAASVVFFVDGFCVTVVGAEDVVVEDDTLVVLLDTEEVTEGKSNADSALPLPVEKTSSPSFSPKISLLKKSSSLFCVDESSPFGKMLTL